MRGRRAGGKGSRVIANATSLAHVGDITCSWDARSGGIRAKQVSSDACKGAGRVAGEYLIAGAAARSALAAIAPVAGDARRAAAVRIRVEVRVLPRTLETSNKKIPGIHSCVRRM